MSFADAPQGRFVTCTLLDHGIYELTFKDSLRMAVDEYFDILAWIVRDKSPDGPTLRILTDGTHIKSFPIVYTAQRAQAFIDKYPDAPSSRYAVLYSEGILFSLMARMVSILRMDQRRTASRYFRAAERDKAIAWLLEETST